MSKFDRELARRDGSGRIVFRDEPLRVRWRLDELAASDGHMLRIAFSCSAQALDNPIERRMLVETLLADRDAVNSDDLSAPFHSPLRAAAARLIAQRAAEQWLDDSARADLTKTLTEAAKPIEFNCGLKLIGPFEVSVESPTFEREKIESMQRRLAERRAAGQVEHVQRAAELLKQFQALR